MPSVFPLPIRKVWEEIHLSPPRDLRTKTRDLFYDPNSFRFAHRIMSFCQANIIGSHRNVSVSLTLLKAQGRPVGVVEYQNTRNISSNTYIPK